MNIDASALRVLNEAIRRQPNSAQLYCERGKLWFDEGQGDFDRAGADYDTALHLDPGLVDARCARADLYRWEKRNAECIARL
jgi:Tfp pilus assembly protein PilF